MRRVAHHVVYVDVRGVHLVPPEPTAHPVPTEIGADKAHARAAGHWPAAWLDGTDLHVERVQVELEVELRVEQLRAVAARVPEAQQQIVRVRVARD